MLQKYTLVMWRKPEKSDTKFDEISKRTYETLRVFDCLPQNDKPNYKAVSSKKAMLNAKEFDWSYENFAKTLKNGVNHVGDQIFENLGFSCSWFSSKNTKESFGYSVHVGVKSKRFFNEITINFAWPIEIVRENSQLVVDLFNKAVAKFEPFYACLLNSMLKAEDSNPRYTAEQVTLRNVHWLNFWSPELMQQVNVKNIDKLKKQYKTQFQVENGFIRVQETAIDATNENEVAYLKLIKKELLG